MVDGWRGSDYWFKVKGEKHSTSKVHKLASVDVEKVASLQEFVKNHVTENRMKQGLTVIVDEQGKPFEMRSLGDFLKWVHGDILKEEQDTIVASQLDMKQLSKYVSQSAKHWYVEQLDKKAFADAA
jgi:hypothetical protein